MSGMKRHREKTAQIGKNLEAVYQEGFRRVLIKSDESGRFVGVYYVTPCGHFLKNMTDVIDWLDNKSPEMNSGLRNSYFNFISKKLTESIDKESIIDQQNLPPELSDYILEKKKSIAPDIKIVNISSAVDDGKEESIVDIVPVFGDCSEESIVDTEMNGDSSEKKRKIEEIQEPQKSPEKQHEIPLDNLVFRPVNPFEQAAIPVNKQYVFESGTLCHEDRLAACLGVVGGYREIAQQFRPYCNNFCAYDSKGSARVTFECDFCLILWHTDCSGYRWLTADTLKFIICDNCYILYKSSNLDLPNIFCDADRLRHLETMISQRISSDPQMSVKFQSIVKLCNLQTLMQKPLSKNVENYLNLKSSKKYIKKDSIPSKPLSNRLKYMFQENITMDNVLRELKDEFICLKYSKENIDQLSKLFSDPECQLMIDDKPVQIFTSRVTVKNGQLFIPINARIIKPCIVRFYTFEQEQDDSLVYRNRCEELRVTMLNSLYNKTDLTSCVNIAENKPVALLKELPRRVIQVTPFSKAMQTANHLKIISKNCVFMPKSNSLISNSVFKTQMGQLGPGPAIVKLRQRKQDFTNQNTQMKIFNNLKNRQFNLLNLPFLILERILSSPCLTTQDKLNCRLTSRVLKCIIDGGRVWSKLVVNPGYITGLENMLTFFRTKTVRKITFCIDFQESFGLEFLLSFIYRLKMFPEYMNLEKFSVKFTGSMMIQSTSTLSVHDILSCCKSLKSLSISSENPIMLADSKKKLFSNVIEKLKLKNVANINSIIQTNMACTPNLKEVFCGDWSLITSLETFPLIHITDLKLFFGTSVRLEDVSAFCLLNNLEKLSIFRPVINDELNNLLVYILQSRRLERFYLETVLPLKNPYDLAVKISNRFAKHIPCVIWRIDFRCFDIDSTIVKTLKRQISEMIPKNVQSVIFC